MPDGDDRTPSGKAISTVLDSNNRLPSSKAISTLSNRDAVRLSSVKGNRTSPFTVGVNKVVFSIIV